MAVLVSEVTMEPSLWKWQGYIFSTAPLLPVYILTWLSLLFFLYQMTQTRRNRADPCWKFSEGDRSFCLAYFQCLGMDQAAVVRKCTVLMC